MLIEVWGVLLIFVVCPILGGLPLIAWITQGLTGRRLDRLGTRNVSVSAAFYHGGQVVGVLAVLSEAFKGIAAVLLARLFFPHNPAWEIVALISLVLGRYWMSRGAGTTNVVWGYVTHDWVSAGLLFIISSISFTILRERQLGRLGVLVLLPLITVLRHPHDGGLFGTTIVLSMLLAAIYRKIPDDLDLPTDTAQGSSRQMFRFFRGDRAILTLDQPLHADKVGAKSATLAQLKRWGYPVPMGWVLPPGDDPAPLIELLYPTPDDPLVVRSSAIGEDSDTASAAGIYESILDVTSKPLLEQAIARCQMSYNRPAGVQYRRSHHSEEGGMAVLVQHQVKSVFSGVAFSRDPITRQGEAVVIEALPGAASQVVSGRFTPEQYRVWIHQNDAPSMTAVDQPESWVLPDAVELSIEGEGDVPPRLIQQIAYLTRHLEAHYHGVPQDIEWSYDGQHIWLLQCRPITTLLPIWTRKIAAEVIPGFIRPLTWSINRPLTCGVWGDLFTLVLGNRAKGLNFAETATLHYSAAYFNASLLGQLFRRMGLPPESLEFLTRGAKFSKPPIASTLRNVPGLMRLVLRELDLDRDFSRDNRKHFLPLLTDLERELPSDLTPTDLLRRIERILSALHRATYYSIMSPLSLALRQALFKVPATKLDNSQTPEVAAMRSLQSLATAARSLVPNVDDLSQHRSTIFAALAENPDGQAVLRQLDEFLEQYGYLSEVGTDIAVPTWREDPKTIREQFVQCLFNPTPLPPTKRKSLNPQVRRVQHRLNLKARVTTVYSRLLAELRWSFIALEKYWLNAGDLKQTDDIFFLTFDEIQRVIQTDARINDPLLQQIEQRRSQFEQDRTAAKVPALVYGNTPPRIRSMPPSTTSSSRRLQGIGASPGQIEGRVLIAQTMEQGSAVDQDTILVVPYTDSGWSPLLARAGGLIAEVGGRLSHGAIVAREYGIPAVMDIHDATQIFHNGQRVRIDGETGIVEML
ncbi:MAG: glycerol-3-phosphate acyltransferase [Oculatellaceae cyanobacterium bins.114]|nr:glycerol-3-phosphate acyltransferase [Oculatellaceae cyanobacterium bins.114]